MNKSTYKCQIIQLLLPMEAAIICQEMGRFAYILSEVLSYWSIYRSDVRCIKVKGRGPKQQSGDRFRPWIDTADLRTVTDPVRILLMKDNFINLRQ